MRFSPFFMSRTLKIPSSTFVYFLLMCVEWPTTKPIKLINAVWSFNFDETTNESII